MEIVIEGMTFTQSGCNNAAAGKKKLAFELKDLLLKIFNENVTDILYTSMKFYDPQYWTDGSDYGIESIRSLNTYFQVSLTAANLDDPRKFFLNGDHLKSLQNRNICGREYLHGKFFQIKGREYRHGEFPNLCCLI